MKARDQSLFDEMYRRSQKLGFKTYDYKPMNEVDYPFVEIEDTQILHRTNKSSILGDVVIVLSVWGLQKKRKQVSDMASALFNEALTVKHSDSYRWSLNVNESHIRMIDDTSTNTPLKRAIVELNFNLIGGI